MAKKRGRKRKSKELTNTHELPGGFWRQIGALLMVVASILFVVTWLGKGGVSLNAVHTAFMTVFGYTTYLFPVILSYLAVMIFRAPDNRLDASVWFASALMVLWFSGLSGIPDYGAANSSGGFVGTGLNSFLVRMVDQGVAVFIYIVLILITALFMYAETPAALFRKIGAIFRTSRTGEDAANARVMRRNTAKASTVDEDAIRDFKVNSNVDIIDHSGKKRSGLLKKSEEKGGSRPDDAPKTALVAVSDPNWQMPSLDLLEQRRSPADPGDMQKNALIIKDTLDQFGIDVEVDGANVGPRITQYTLRPPAGVKVAKIAQLDRDLTLNLAKDKIRIEAPIPGTRQVGVEIPNDKAASVGLHELLKTNDWKRASADNPLAFAIGKDISGQPVVGDLAKMPHLLIAGTTNSGKSVMTNALITSMLFHDSPSDLRLIIIDPKQVEMAAYEDIPHLLSPVITSVDKALSALKWSVNEMERRYTLMKEERVKNIADYNHKLAKSGGKVSIPDDEGNEQHHDGGKMPYIVLVVDEMSDLMMMAGKELENYIVRIAQKGRAAGMHLVLATQRPEVKVVTGLIKANIPGRIAFAVTNSIDSRVMLDKSGAEKLLGNGDMLYLTTDMMGKPRRVQGAFVSDGEISRITNFLREQAPPNYNEDVISQPVQIKGMPGMNFAGGDAFDSEGGDLERQAAEIAVQARKLSTSLLQRRLHIGYGRASSIIDNLEDKGVVAPPSGGNRPRDVLISSMDEYPG